MSMEEPSDCSLPLHVMKEDWQDGTHKLGSATNSQLLLLTVEYMEDSGTSIVYSPNPGGSEQVSPLDPTMACSGRYTSLYNTLMIPAGTTGQQTRSLVMVPAPRTCSPHAAQINILVDPAQMAQQLVVEQDSYPKESPVRPIMDEYSPESCHPHEVTIGGNDASAILVPSFFEEEKECGSRDDLLESSLEDDFSASASPHENLLETIETKSEPVHDLLHGDETAEFVMSRDDVEQDDLLLSATEHTDQNHELLMKADSLMEVNAYNLEEEEAYMEEEMKGGSEYLMSETMTFEDSNSGMLEGGNLEVFASGVLDNNTNVLAKMLRIKKHPPEHFGLDYWCEDCNDTFGIKCSRHEMKIISDKPILTRARASLPKDHLAINKLPNNPTLEGVFARKTIGKRVQFGPVEGLLLVGFADSWNNAEGLELLLEVETGQLLRMDLTDEDESNWMRFVRPAKTLKEQNLVLTQQGRSLYFITTKVIPPRHELLVGYSQQYSERRKLRMLLEPLSQAEPATPQDVDKELEDISNKTSKKKLVDEMRRRRMDKKTLTAPLTAELECWTCHKQFPRSYSLKRHRMRIHGDEGKDKENKGEADDSCEEKYVETNSLFRKKQTGNNSSSEWLCTHCTLTFDNPSLLNLHTLTHAAEDIESEAVLGPPSDVPSQYQEGDFLVQTGDVQCPQCTQQFPSKRALIDHVTTHGKKSRCCRNKVKSPQLQAVEPCKPFKCDSCYKAFTTDTRLHKHMMVHGTEEDKPFKCDSCYKAFTTDTRLHRHMLVHGAEEDKPFKCDTCLKRFLNNSALSCHLKTHYGRKGFECLLCKEEFDQAFVLKEHVKIHSHDGVYTCPHCHKLFDGYSVVRKHVRSFHSGHQHVCNECGKLCPTLDKLRMHSLRHSDHREFLCANCGKQFKRKDKLKEHMKRMHSVDREAKTGSSTRGDGNSKDRRFTPKMSPMAFDRYIYKCRNCMVGFKRRGMLVNHLAKRHPDIIPGTVPELNLPILKTTRDYFCQYCDKIYRSSSKRKAHILKNHPGAQLPMSNRQKGGIPYIPGMPNPTYSQTVGSVKTTPHGCQWCHKQYASKAKLLQHQRKKHMTLLPRAQQVPRPARNSSSPVGSDAVDSPPTPPSALGCGEEGDDDDEVDARDQLNTGVFELTSDVTDGLDVSPLKKSLKGLPENISCDLLSQAMVELSESLLPQEHLLQPYPPR